MQKEAEQQKSNRNVAGLLVKCENAAAHGAFGSLFVFELCWGSVSTAQ
jgi:hypothetical protein